MANYIEEGYNKRFEYGERASVDVGALEEGGSSISSSPVLNEVAIENVLGGELVDGITVARDSFIRGGATDYNEGEGFWIGSRKTERDHGLFIGNASGNKLTYNTTDDILSVTGTIVAGAGEIGGWTISDPDIYSGNVRLESDTERILLGSATAPLTGNGIFIGKDGSDYEFRAGNPAGDYMHWTGSQLDIVTTTIDINGTGFDETSAATLTGGGNADDYHEHNPKQFIPLYASVPASNGIGLDSAIAGYSDALAPRRLSVTFRHNRSSGTLDTSFLSWIIGESGFQKYIQFQQVLSAQSPSPSAFDGGIQIGTDEWICSSVAGFIYKNNGGATFSGTARYGPLGHDVTNSYLLVLYSTTKIAKFSGIAGTTITNLNADITLDTAVKASAGFIWDDVNSRVIAFDSVNNVIRRFTSAGVTVDTVALPTSLDSNLVKGVCFIDDRVYIVTVKGLSGSPMQMFIDLIPTDMRRE